MSWSTFLSADFLNGVGVVGIVLLVGWLITTGRLVTRKNHEEVIQLYKDASVKDARTIQNLGEALNKKNVNDIGANHVLSAIRDVVSTTSTGDPV